MLLLFDEWWQIYSMETWSKYWACSTLFRSSSSTLSQQPEVMFQWCHRLMLITWWRHHSRGSVSHVISSYRPILWKRGEQNVCVTTWLVWSFDTRRRISQAFVFRASPFWHSRSNLLGSRQKHIKCLALDWTHKINSDISPAPPLNFTILPGGGAKMRNLA